MIIYVTRHGQPDLDGANWEGDPDKALCDPSLTAQGREQAKHLGKYLLKRKFSGKIISSPYRRTLETAQIVAKVNALSIIPEPAIQEIFYSNSFENFGLNMQRILNEFPNVKENPDLKRDWLPKSVEDFPMVKQRVGTYLKKLLTEMTPNEEILLVGHGASVHACKELFLENAFYKNIPEKHNWNCSLSSYIFDEARRLRKYKLFDIRHMPENIITSNKRSYSKELQYAV